MRPPSALVDVAIVGAGIAGATVAEALTRRGLEPWLLDAGAHPAAGASGNPAAVVKPAVAREASAITAFLDACWTALSIRLADESVADAAGFRRIGVLQLLHKAWRDRVVPHGRRWPILDAHAASARAGVDIDGPAIWFDDGGWLNLEALTRWFAGHAGIHFLPNSRLTRVSRAPGNTWRLTLESSEPPAPKTTTFVARHIVMATASASIDGVDLHRLPLLPVAGQTTRWRAPRDAAPLRCVLSGRHYAFRDARGWVSGATYARHRATATLRDGDHDINRHALQSLLRMPSSRPAADWTAVGGFAGVRATTPDRLPMAGSLPDFDACRARYAELHHGRASIDWNTVPAVPGRWVLTGLGSRGLLFAPLLADYLASRIVGDAEHKDFTPLVDPVRFLLRDLKRHAGEAQEPPI